MKRDCREIGDMEVLIEDFVTEELKNGRFVHPMLARYRQDGEERSWEIVEAGDSVAVLIYHTQRDSFIFVKQFRPAVYHNIGCGMTIELCAGILDKNLSPEETAIEEIEEECGYRISGKDIERVTSFHTSVGFAGNRQTLFYAEVDDSMRVGDGGGIENERIEVIEIARDEVDDLIMDERIPKTPGLMYAIKWWADGVSGFGG